MGAQLHIEVGVKHCSFLSSCGPCAPHDPVLHSQWEDMLWRVECKDEFLLRRCLDEEYGGPSRLPVLNYQPDILGHVPYTSTSTFRPASPFA